MDQIHKKIPQRVNVLEVTNTIMQTLVPVIKQSTIHKKNKEALKGTMHDLMLELMKTMVINELKDEFNGENDFNNSINPGDEIITRNGAGNHKKVALEKVNQKLGLTKENLVPADPQNINSVSLDDLDDIDLATIEKLESKGVRVIFPNLKYRQPKYQKMDSVLKYVETEDDDKYGVKLVIMNFND